MSEFTKTSLPSIILQSKKIQKYLNFWITWKPLQCADQNIIGTKYLKQKVSCLPIGALLSQCIWHHWVPTKTNLVAMILQSIKKN